MVGRKGIFFSIIALLIIFLISIIFSLMRIEFMSETNLRLPKAEYYSDYYSLLVEEYLPFIVQVSGRATLDSLSHYSIDQKFLSSSEFNTSLYSLMNGSGLPCAYCSAVMYNHSLKYLINDIERMTNEVVFSYMNLSIVPLYNQTIVYQETPWEVFFRVPFEIKFGGPDFIFYDDEYVVETTISILNITDPFLGVYSNETILKPIIYDPDYYLSPTNFWSFDKVNESINKSYFFPRKTGRSFLMRLQNLSDDPNSLNESFIESFINPRDLSLLQHPVSGSLNERNFIDHYFFENVYTACNLPGVSSSTFLYEVLNLPSYYSNFRLDLNSSVFYLGGDFQGGIAPKCP